jgi:hypothetical protein
MFGANSDTKMLFFIGRNLTGTFYPECNILG